MRLRRPASTAAAAVAIAAATALAASPAHAAEQWITFSYESPSGGWGYSTVTTGTSLKQLTCDQGTPDGLRTVSHLTMPNGNVHTLHASQGSGKCIDGSYSPMRGTYTLRVCLRNGAYGTDRHCDQNTFQY
ncbi:hypothetical protein [Streptomyces sp. F001]|uniref:hypothetical protein n=1 Tax=Streptomyces sp. F001 TaxID=1510026 RepID=UPI00101E7788|nr:hypothetical protein [Streptomyces sp. F001]RZB13298.1 hypothetical protein StrepF001_44935 [Streptomyces sp. F001]